MFSFLKNKKPLLSQEICDAVAASIAANERRSSGEIRVYVETRCEMVNPIERCEGIFVKLNMHQTAERNGVLLYLALKDRQFAVVGDQGINGKVGGNDYWQRSADLLKSFLSKGEIKEGICAVVDEIGKTLTLHYPEDSSENINELPDEIVFGA